jgi:hypothetical protein
MVGVDDEHGEGIPAALPARELLAGYFLEGASVVETGEEVRRGCAAKVVLFALLARHVARDHDVSAPRSVLLLHDGEDAGAPEARGLLARPPSFVLGPATFRGAGEQEKLAVSEGEAAAGRLAAWNVEQHRQLRETQLGGRAFIASLASSRRGAPARSPRSWSASFITVHNSVCFTRLLANLPV